ncbi:MAG TPA: hypothetical protein VFQ22_06150 [Longimicrobiales bacterium]|nr:hypothetical protein [Longimicrobiales bacterium]
MARASVAGHAAAALLALLVAACGEATPNPPDAPESGGAGDAEPGAERQTFEQSFVFAAVSGDSAFFVPWLMRTTAYPDSAVRGTRGWLGRSGTWEAFYDEEWTTPATRAPSRILPHGSLDLLVEEGDGIDGIVFDDGARHLELALGDVEAAWGGPRGETVELFDGMAYLADERLEGFVLHLARASVGDAPPGGDWALLVSGDSLRLVLSADVEHGGGTEPLYRGWARLRDEERLWTRVRVDWTAMQAFPPARRDVPAGWRIRSAEGMLDGELAQLAAEIRPGEGPGPLLPVLALFEVTGEMAIEDGVFPVRGLLVHERR